MWIYVTCVVEPLFQHTCALSQRTPAADSLDLEASSSNLSGVSAAAAQHHAKSSAAPATGAKPRCAPPFSAGWGKIHGLHW